MAKQPTYSKSAKATYGKVSASEGFFCIASEAMLLNKSENEAILVAHVETLPGVQKFNDNNWKWEPQIVLIPIYLKNHEIEYQGKKYPREVLPFMKEVVEKMGGDNLGKPFSVMLNDAGGSTFTPLESVTKLAEVKTDEITAQSGGGNQRQYKSKAETLAETLQAIKVQLQDGSELEQLVTLLNEKGESWTVASVAANWLTGLKL